MALWWPGGKVKDQLVGRHYSELVDEDHLEMARNLFNERRSGSRAVTNVELKFKSDVAEYSRLGVRCCVYGEPKIGSANLERIPLNDA